MRTRIIAAASALVAKGGVAAATTRAVALAASVQPPAIYRLFGDKDGLLHAVAEEVYRRSFVASKHAPDPEGDVVQQLRAGWDQYVAFGLAHQEVFVLVNASHSHAPSPAKEAGLAVLRERVRLIARTGRLKVSEERAVALIDAMSTGTVLILQSMPAVQRAGLAKAAREGVLSLVLDEKAPAARNAPAKLASALRTHVKSVAHLTPGERLLMDELLQRIATPHGG